MSLLAAVADIFTAISGGALLFAAVTLGLALHRRKLPRHARTRRRIFRRR